MGKWRPDVVSFSSSRPLQTALLVAPRAFVGYSCLAKEVISLDTEIANTDTMIEDRFRRHRHAETILSMPGFGVTLGAFAF